MPNQQSASIPPVGGVYKYRPKRVTSPASGYFNLARFRSLSHVKTSAFVRSNFLQTFISCFIYICLLEKPELYYETWIISLTISTITSDSFMYHQAGFPSKTPIFTLLTVRPLTRTINISWKRVRVSHALEILLTITTKENSPFQFTSLSCQSIYL